MDSRGEEGEGWMEDQWEKWLTHDISLEEFEDEDLSEITDIKDECGMSLNCNGLEMKGHVRRGTNSVSGRAELGAVGHIHTEMLHLDLIDDADSYCGDTDPSKPCTTASLPVTKDPVATVTMDTYRPKRPTTLNLFPMVPRTQDTLNNNSFGKKFSWQEKVSRSSSPLKTGDHSPPHEHTCLSDEDKQRKRGGAQVGGAQVGVAQTKDCGTSTDGPCRRSLITTGTRSKLQDRKPPPPPPPPQDYTPAPLRPEGGGTEDRIQYTTDVCLEPTEEIYLTPVLRSSESLNNHDHDHAHDQPDLLPSQQPEQGRMSFSSDTEAPPPYQPLPDRTNPCISEEDEVYMPPPPSYASCMEELATPPAVVPLSGSTPLSGSALDMTLQGAGMGVVGAGLGVEFVDDYGEEEEEEDRGIRDGPGKEGGGGGRQGTDRWLGDTRAPPRTSMSSEASGLSYDSVKYTLVVDEHAQLELISLRQCYQGYSDDSDTATVYDNCVSSTYESAIGEEYEEEEGEEEVGEEEEEEGEEPARVGEGRREATACLSDDSTPDADLNFSKKFLNVFLNGHSRSSSAESFGLFSCVINGEERDQTHRAMYRFVPRHADELELEVDDPLLVTLQGEDYWYEGYNMRSGAHGIFPAFYATEIAKEPRPLTEVSSSDWVDRYSLKFLGSVQVPYHKGNDVLCAAMQKIATNRRMTVQYNPPSSCILEINMKGVKLMVQDDYYTSDRSNECNHFFQLKNVSFCGYHPKNSKYFGFITKHPADQRFACHVFVSDSSTKPLAQSVGKAFQLYYKEFVEFSCPTEDIYLE